MKSKKTKKFKNCLVVIMTYNNGIDLKKTLIKKKNFSLLIF